MEHPRPEISFIIPAYNEEGNILRLYDEHSSVMSGLCVRYEAVVVDDGSTDDTWNVIAAIKDYKVKAFRFPLNVGESSAIAHGFSWASGEAVITLDADMQDDPKEIPKFPAAQKDYKVVTGWKHPRHDMNCRFKAYRAYTLKCIGLPGELNRYILVMLFGKGF